MTIRTAPVPPADARRREALLDIARCFAVTAWAVQDVVIRMPQSPLRAVFGAATADRPPAVWSAIAGIHLLACAAPAAVSRTDHALALLYHESGQRRTRR